VRIWTTALLYLTQSFYLDELSYEIVCQSIIKLKSVFGLYAIDCVLWHVCLLLS
jgi:hypothetical protein